MRHTTIVIKKGCVHMAHKNGTSYPEEFKQQIVDIYNAGTSVT